MVEGKGKGEEFLRGLGRSGRGCLLPLIHIWARSPVDGKREDREDHDALVRGNSPRVSQYIQKDGSSVVEKWLARF